MRFGKHSLFHLKWNDARKKKPKKTCFVFLRLYDESSVTPLQIDNHCVDPSNVHASSVLFIYDKNARLFNGSLRHPESAINNVYEWAEVPEELCPFKMNWF